MSKRYDEEFLTGWDWEERRDHLVNWAICCRFRTFGDLGIGSLKLRNFSLLVKWLRISCRNIIFCGIK